jgi:hypothetical protein
MNENIGLFSKAPELWKFLQTEGGLDIKRYDASIVDELRSKLSLPSRQSFEKALLDKKISAGDLIVAFFQVVQPYAEMMTEILKMFEKAGAKRTTKSLKISFDFGKDLEKLRFNLSHFKDWIETWNKIVSRYVANLWNIGLLWCYSNL